MYSYHHIIAGNYDRAIEHYKQRLGEPLNPLIVSYLGLAYFLRGDTTEADQTWARLTNAEHLSLLRKILITDAERQERLSQWDTAYQLRKRAYELSKIDSPHNLSADNSAPNGSFTDLLLLILSGLRSNHFASEIIDQTQILTILSQKPSLTDKESELLLEVVIASLETYADQDWALTMLETSLPKFVDRGSASADIIKVSFEVERKFTPQLATKIAEILLAHNPNDYHAKIAIYLILAQRYARASNFDQALSIIRQHQELVKDSALDGLIGNESFLNVLLSLYEYWKECLEINETSARLSHQLAGYPTITMKLYQPAALMAVGFFAPYFADRPRENMYLRKVCKDIADQKLVERNEEFVSGYRH
jgi:tetratricopeptide (TPR) repeat protein